jgi:hypothetical protein
LEERRSKRQINLFLAGIVLKLQDTLSAYDLPALVMSANPGSFLLMPPSVQEKMLHENVDRLRTLLPSACLPWSISYLERDDYQITLSGITYVNATEAVLAGRFDDFTFIDEAFQRSPQDTIQAYAFGYEGDMAPERRFASLWGASPEEAGIKLLLSLKPGIAQDPENTLSADPDIAGPMHMREVKSGIEMDLAAVLSRARRFILGPGPEFTAPLG